MLVAHTAAQLAFFCYGELGGGGYVLQLHPSKPPFFHAKQTTVFALRSAHAKRKTNRSPGIPDACGQIHWSVRPTI